MIKKLRIKFIILSMVAVFVLLGLVVAGMNVINYRAVVQEAKETLVVIAQNKGTFPEMKPDGQDVGGFMGSLQAGSAEGETGGIVPEGETGGMLGAGDAFGQHTDGNLPEKKELPNGMNPETPYESRFFSVLLSDDGKVQMTDIRMIASVTEEDASEYAVKVYSEGNTEGFINDYLFMQRVDEEGIRITFLDCGRKLNSFRTFLIISLIASAVGYLLFFFVIFFYSKRITRPVAESYEKQKRFITDAGHEIKTPLAIIKADADVLEMDLENNEWVSDIQKQTERLSSLTNDLVSLARMEEGRGIANMTEFAVSDAVEEEVSAYQMLAQSEKKELDIQIQQAIFMNGNEKNIRRLVNIFMDNAMKYSPENTQICLTLKKTGRSITLSVFNKTKEAISKENLKLLFDRFYRIDSSRNSETGGHGIGLSMAKAIVEEHDGKIYATSEDGMSLTMEAQFPVA